MSKKSLLLPYLVPLGFLAFLLSGNFISNSAWFKNKMGASLHVIKVKSNGKPTIKPKVDPFVNDTSNDELIPDMNQGELSNSEVEGNPEYKTALELYNNREYQEALGHFLVAESSTSGNPLIRSYTAVAYMKLGQLDSAKKTLIKLIKDFSTFDVAYYNLGILYLKLNQNDSAEFYLKEAVKLNRSARFSLAYYNLGLIEQKRNHFTLSEKYYQKCLKLNPGHINSRYNLGLLYIEKHKYIKARSQFEMCLKLDPKDARFYFK